MPTGYQNDDNNKKEVTNKLLCDAMWRYVMSCDAMWLLFPLLSIVVCCDEIFVMLMLMVHFTLILCNVMWRYVTRCDVLCLLFPLLSIVVCCDGIFVMFIVMFYCFTIILSDVMWRYVTSWHAMWLQVTSFGFMKNCCIQWCNVCNAHCDVLRFTLILSNVMCCFVSSRDVVLLGKCFVKRCTLMWCYICNVQCNVLYVTLILSDIMSCYVTSRDVFLWWNALLKYAKY
jgi:hypothetical protein